MGKLMKTVGMVCLKMGLFSALKILNYLHEQCLRVDFFFHMLISKVILVLKNPHQPMVASKEFG